MGNYRDDFSRYDIVLFFNKKNHFSFYGKNPICIDTIGKKKIITLTIKDLTKI